MMDLGFNQWLGVVGVLGVLVYLLFFRRRVGVLSVSNRVIELCRVFPRRDLIYPAPVMLGDGYRALPVRFERALEGERLVLFTDEGDAVVFGEENVDFGDLWNQLNLVLGGGVLRLNVTLTGETVPWSRLGRTPSLQEQVRNMEAEISSLRVRVSRANEGIRRYQVENAKLLSELSKHTKVSVHSEDAVNLDVGKRLR